MKKMICLIVSFILLTAMMPCAFADATLDDYFTGRLDYAYAVYSGPGEDYFRANSGKAQYGKGGVARIYGVDPNGWVMIGYELGSGDYRIGYVEPGAAWGITVVKGDGALYELSFDFSPAVIGTTCALTDDPVINNKTILTLKQGTPCTYLAAFGTRWSYIEVSTDKGLMRGFVRAGNVTSSYPPYVTPRPETYELSYQKGRFQDNYPVYSGPGTDFPQAGSGKATLGAKGVCRIYGTDGDWLLVGYETAGGDYRIGYITDYLLPDSLQQPVQEVDYAWKWTYLTADAQVTDDPVINMKPIETLKKGTNVTFLAWTSAKHNYALVEYYSYTLRAWMRGFVKGRYLNDTP